ncbi:MAG: NAD(P)/FAD-dependent oxidoreductase [Nocardiaceae bacterium]|nr:NAD(P)/FAD-dependent oxidoreductase [Nocardiaceae bacterium]
MTENVDAVVIGAGVNGLVAAITLADAGWDVLVLEEQTEPGGAVRSAELFPGFVSDLFSAFYPLGAASPVLSALDLASHGLKWSYAPTVLAHPCSPDDSNPAVIHPDRDATAALLREFNPRDGDAWLRLCDQWEGLRKPLLDALLGPFPPIRAATSLFRSVGTEGAIRLARFLSLSAHRMGHELFQSEQARLLLMGNATHADIPLTSTGSGFMGYLLAMLGQEKGFPVPLGGAAALTSALVARARSAGVQIRKGQRVTTVRTGMGHATGVTTESGLEINARRAVVADVTAPALYRELLEPATLPEQVRSDLDKFEWDNPVVKINYALREGVPWRANQLADAGTVHLGADEKGLIRWNCDLTTGVIPERPFILFGQMTTADPTRSPAGTESAWAYTHLPSGVNDDESAHMLAERVDQTLEAYAPGFTDVVIGRAVQTPKGLEAADSNLVNGAIGGGTSQLHQQLVFRPIPGLGRPETPIERLYLASSSAHPGGGVHGACGHNAAAAALLHSSRLKWPRSKLVRRLTGLMEAD